MNMNFMNQQENGSSGSDQFADSMAQNDQEFTLTEDRKPVNRNAIVLLLIAAVGGGLIYMMYLRGNFSPPPPDADQQAAAAKIDVMTGAEGQASLAKLETDIQRTKQLVGGILAVPGGNQVSPDKVRVNPFASDTPRPPTTTVVIDNTVDPLVEVRDAIARATVTGVLCGSAVSTCTVNGKPYALGEKVKIDNVPLVITNISPDHIVLKHKLGEFSVPVAKNELKQN